MTGSALVAGAPARRGRPRRPVFAATFVDGDLVEQPATDVDDGAFVLSVVVDPAEVDRARVRCAEIQRRIVRRVFKPRPRLTVSEWANRYRFLSPEASFRVGQYSTDDAPYQKEFLDACGDPNIEQVVGEWASQLGKTESVNSLVGYYIDQQPSPILVVQPTEKMGETWSKDRLDPMLRDTPRLHGRVADAKTRSGSNTILHKQFTGGHITIAGANAPSGLASRPIRVLILDELDRFPPVSGKEGDPASIAESRTQTFPNRKIVKVSSPTYDDAPIAKAYAQSDQRLYFVPCPLCGHEQVLTFGGKDVQHGLHWQGDDPNTVHYVCVACLGSFDESHKPAMLRLGRWIPQNPGHPVAGFRLSALYSPFFTWRKLVARWIKDHADPLKLQTFVNTILCEYWTEKTERLDAHALAAHVEPFPRGDDPEHDPQPIVPHGVGILTRAVDVQGDRLEVAVYGLGPSVDDLQFWRVDWKILPGDPATAEPWNALAEELTAPYYHESGAPMYPQVTFVDSGSGHHTKAVYDFARVHAPQRVYAIKGSSKGEGVPLLGPPQRHKTQRVVTYQVGSFTGKDWLVKALAKITAPGPGFVHFPDDIDRARLDQFLNETVQTRYPNGRPVRTWIQKGPNEEIDLFVYCMAAFYVLRPVVRNGLAKRAAALSAWTPDGIPRAPGAKPAPARRRDVDGETDDTDGGRLDAMQAELAARLARARAHAQRIGRKNGANYGTSWRGGA